MRKSSDVTHVQMEVRGDARLLYPSMLCIRLVLKRTGVAKRSSGNVYTEVVPINARLSSIVVLSWVVTEVSRRERSCRFAEHLSAWHIAQERGHNRARCSSCALLPLEMDVHVHSYTRAVSNTRCRTRLSAAFSRNAASSL